MARYDVDKPDAPKTKGHETWDRTMTPTPAATDKKKPEMVKDGFGRWVEKGKKWGEK